MDRRMLINAIHAEECRIAIEEDGILRDLEIESFVGKKLKGNIYKAKISRIEPSLQAAFVDIGTERNGFLQINDIHPSYFVASGSQRNHRRTSWENIKIQEVLNPGQELVVQVVKEEREQKGATLTTYLSLPGRYIVLMPGSDRGGVSRKIMDDEQRHRLRRLVRELEMPSGIGLIIRTAGLDRSQSELSRDLSLQIKLWEKIVAVAQDAPCPTMLYKESDLATRVVRDYFTPEIRDIVIDHEDTYKRVREFVDEVMPRYRSRVRLYDKRDPIFSYYKIEEQVSDTLKSEVKLKSGGAIIIDPLEALVAIDVNSGKATAGDNIEDTAYRTNLEAVDEIVRQLRLRDLGGLIVIDFIDMMDRRHRSAVERKVLEAVKTDKAKVEVGRLSKFGLMEMSRQRLRASLSSQSHLKCPQCQGAGTLKNTESVALEVLRKIQSAVLAGQIKTIKARLAPAPALFLLNNKKAILASLEAQYTVSIYILADGRLRQDEHEFEIESARKKAVEEITKSIEHPTNTESESPEQRGPTLLETEDEESEEDFQRHARVRAIAAEEGEEEDSSETDSTDSP